jgi:hypothetical protein
VKLVALTALAAALLATPALAAEAQVDVSYAYNEPSTGDSVTATGVAGKAVWMASDTMGVQLDGAWAHLEGGTGSFLGLPSGSSSQLTAHLFGRNDEGALGLFAGSRDVKAGFTLTYDYAGIEAQRYFGDVTLEVAAGKGRLGALFANPESYGAGAEARFFRGDNTRFDLRGGISHADAGVFTGETDLWNVGVGFEHRFDGPLSLFAAYDYAEGKDAGYEANVLTVGVRMNFGADTLKGRERSGPGLGGDRLFAKAVDFVF